MPEGSGGCGSGVGVGVAVGVGAGVEVGVVVGFSGGTGVAEAASIGSRVSDGVTAGAGTVGGVVGATEVPATETVAAVGVARTGAEVGVFERLLASPQPARRSNPAASPAPSNMRILFIDAIPCPVRLLPRSRTRADCHSVARERPYVVLPSSSQFYCRGTVGVCDRCHILVAAR
jgi:hypothetical protein